MKIGFEEILGLLFLVFFVIVPLFTKKSKGPTSRPPRAPGPGQGPARQASGPGHSSPAGGGGGRVVADTGGQPGSWREILQEVQRRVQSAEATEAAASGRGPVVGEPSLAGRATPGHMPQASAGGQAGTAAPAGTAGASGRPGSSGGGLVRSDPFGGGLVQGQTTSSSLGREGARFVPPDEADPARVTRLRSKGRTASGAMEAVAALDASTRRPRDLATAARLGTAVPHEQPFIGTSRSELVRGMIWHEILSEPAAVRRLRRTR